MAIAEGEARASDICAPLTMEGRSVDTLQSMSPLVSGIGVSSYRTEYLDLTGG